MEKIEIIRGHRGDTSDQLDSTSISVNVDNTVLCPPEIDCGRGDAEKSIQRLIDVPEVLEAILKKFNTSELLQLRPVSKFWNKEICHVLMTRPIPLDHWVNYIKIWHFWTSDYGSVMRIKQTEKGLKLKSWDWKNILKTEGSFKELCTLLGKSENPNLLLKNVKVLSIWDFPTVIPGCQNLIQDFGKFVTRLEIQLDVDLQSLKKFLFRKEPLCPNLEVLNYSIFYSNSNSNANAELVSLEVMHTHRKLKKLSFTTPNDSLTSIERVALRNILDNSPQLISLRVIAKSSAASAMTDCLELLQIVPQVTTNLTTLTLQGNVLPLVKHLNKIKFSSTLKNILFEEKFYTGRNAASESADEDLMKFLKLVGHSLEVLNIEETSEQFLYPNPETKVLRGLPLMPKLKTLTLSEYNFDAVQERDFLKKVPSLKVLNVYDFERFRGFLKFNRETGIIHENLEQINLLNAERYNKTQGHLCIRTPTTIQLMSEVFPKFKEFRMILKAPHDTQTMDEVRVWFEEFFLAISQMQNLKTLEITLTTKASHPLQGRLDLIKAFAYLRELPNLETLSFFRKETFFNFPEEQWLMELISAPKLRNLKFYGFKMPMETYNKMIEEFRSRNITLSFPDMIRFKY